MHKSPCKKNPLTDVNGKQGLFQLFSSNFMWFAAMAVSLENQDVFGAGMCYMPEVQ